MKLKMDIAHTIKCDLEDIIYKLSAKVDNNGICTYVADAKVAIEVLDDLERLVQHYKYS